MAGFFFTRNKYDMLIKELLNESMTFHAGNENGNVFPKEWGDRYIWDGHDPVSQDPPPENPDYHPEFDISLSNENMQNLMTELGFDGSDQFHYKIPIDMFIGKCQQWLKQHINKPRGGEETHIEKSHNGATMITGGRPDNYFNSLIINTVRFAKEGKKLGATYIGAY